MRIQVNLATRPFVELRPFFLRLRLLMALLAVAGLALAVGAHLVAARAAVQQHQLDLLRDQTISAQEAKLHTEREMRQPANAAVLDRAHFLNTLFLKKSFSWTAVMMDLENVLPVGVQVTSIEPAVTTDGTVIIRLRVAGERDRAVQLVRNLERSHRFLYPRLGSESAQAREQVAANGQHPAPGAAAAPAGPPGVEFEILADYNPLPAGESYTVGHGGVSSAAAAGAALARARETRSEAQGTNPGENQRNGYPRNGVVLPPYGAGNPAGVSRTVGRPAAPLGAQSGGGPR